MYRGFYTLARRYEFYVRVARTRGIVLVHDEQTIQLVDVAFDEEFPSKQLPN